MRGGAEWAVALGAGLAVFAAAWFLLPASDTGPAAPGPEGLPHLPSHYQTPFSNVTELPATIVVVDPRGHLVTGEEGVAGERLWAVLGDGTEAVRLAQVTDRPEAECPTPCGLRLAWQPGPPGAPRLLQDNHTTAVLSVYVFDDVGSLLATTGDDTRFGTPSIRLPSTWHLGPGPAPEGAVAAASLAGGLLRDYLPLLEGLPPGGIASARITAHPYAGLVGPITVTAQVGSIATS